MKPLAKLAAIATVAVLAACQTTAPRMKYVRIDGQSLEGVSALTAQADTDWAICLGEVAKASAGMSAPRSIGQGREQDALRDTILVGCMAQRGYRQVPA